MHILDEYLYFSTGYVQGMNDILSPLLFVLESEHQAFWCFTDVMKRMVGLVDRSLAHALIVHTQQLCQRFKLLYKCTYAITSFPGSNAPECKH